MKTSDRREFLGVLLKGTGIGLLSMLPGTFFHQRKAMAMSSDPAKDFGGILKSTNVSNYVNVLNTSKLSQEQIVAIAAVRELDRSSVNRIIGDAGKPGVGKGCGGNCTIAKDAGKACGGRCVFGGIPGGTSPSPQPEPPEGSPPTGPTPTDPAPGPTPTPGSATPGSACGNGCAVPANAIGVIDKMGRLKVDFSRLNMQSLRSALLEAQQLGN